MTIIEEEEVEEEEETLRTMRQNQPPPVPFINSGNNTGSTQQMRNMSQPVSLSSTMAKQMPLPQAASGST
jgi:hypothetical protein